jgi:polyisoprenoid-binding protein YceI
LKHRALPEVTWHDRANKLTFGLVCIFWPLQASILMSRYLGDDNPAERGNPLKTTYKIDPAHSSAQFVVRHMMITNVRGGFSGVQGTIEHDAVSPKDSRVEVVIDADTINTLDEQRDAHLKSPDFLKVEQHPTITFKSKKIAPAGDGEWKVTGDLTILGVTKEVVLHAEGPTPEAKDPFGNTRIGASASTKIKRSEFGLTWNAALETGGILIGDDLKIELEVSAIRLEAAAAA